MRRAGILSFLIACGTTEPNVNDAGVDATSKDGNVSFDGTFLVDAGDAAIDVTSPPPNGPCPSTAPTAGTSCANVGVGLECEYGSSWYVHCDAVFECGDAGTWTGGTIASCPNDGNCPSDPDAAPSCTPIVGPCDYADRHCECATQCGGPCCGNGWHWECSVPSKNACPFPRPDLGTACSTEGQECSYGGCCTGSLLGCHGGLWRTEPCPVPP